MALNNLTRNSYPFVLTQIPVKALLLAAVVTVLLVSCASDPDESTIPLLPSTGPTIEFTKIPRYNSFENLEGRVSNANPTENSVAVFIYVSGWWTKPYWARPKTTIRPDGTWECDVTTGGSDQRATRFAAFVIRTDHDPPLLRGERELPDVLRKNSVASIEIERARS